MDGFDLPKILHGADHSDTPANGTLVAVPEQLGGDIIAEQLHTGSIRLTPSTNFDTNSGRLGIIASTRNLTGHRGIDQSGSRG